MSHLVDEATIFVRSGKGGDGCVSFRREKFVPKGGPDGGDGGKGGDVVLAADSALDTLLHLVHRPHIRAENGQPGMGKSMTGRAGEDRVVRVPAGTLVYDAETHQLVADLDEPGKRAVVARGGRGGLGNEHFKSATNQTPREATPGEPWEEETLRLELKIIADIGLVGMPNAGKSTMLAAVSRARPKIADYPFTTLQPHLGIAELPGERRLVIADIPGLIEGAAGGAGLGHDFLRHIERTRVLVHLLDVGPAAGAEDSGDLVADAKVPADQYRAIRRELTEYSPQLAEKPEIVVLNKIDLVPEDRREDVIAAVTSQLNLPQGVHLITASGATSHGLREILEACWAILSTHFGASDAPGWERDRVSRHEA